MNIDLGKSTNKGTALLRLAHQFQPEVLFRDEYVSWFFNEDLVRSLRENPLSFDFESKDESEDAANQKIAYWYVILREKHGDQVIEAAIASGCKQVLLLGSGYDTRFFRLPSIRKNFISTLEVDLPKTIEDKRNCLIKKLGQIPQGLTLVPLDFNQEDLNIALSNIFDSTIPTVYVWQGVSYYLPHESVSSFLDFIKAKMSPDSVFVFDCCSPLITFKNDQVPGINSQIDQLNEISEPYLFGLQDDEMEAWLKQKGFHDIQILKLSDLEAQFLSKRTLPNNMWYVVTANA